MLTSLLTTHAFAGYFDVHGQGKTFVKVTVSEDKQSVSFKECLKTERESCVRIGALESYDIEQLKDLRGSEKWDVLKAGAADVAALIIAVGGGALIGGAIFASGGLASLGAPIIGMGIGAGGAITLSIAVDALNPVEQYRQLETLEDDVITDIDVQYRNEDKDFC